MLQDYPNVQNWIKIISELNNHIQMVKENIFCVDNDYVVAVESLNYLLIGKEIVVQSLINNNKNNK